MIHAALLGTGIGHSLSPLIHTEAARRRGLDLVYELWETDRAGLAPALERARHQGLAGLNITAPLKEAVLPLVQHLEPGAARAGSVNLLLPGPGGWDGRSTDGAGFLAPLEGLGVLPARVVLLGAGGAARAVAHALRERWPACALELRARRPEQARALAATLPGGPASLAPLAAPLPEHTDLLVNATPLGMAGGPGWPEADRPTGLERVATVYDLVSVPRLTPLLEAAHRAGCRILGGHAMLVAQAAPAFEAFTGTPFPGPALERLVGLRLTLAGTLDRPLVLTGFMGSGKSTLAPLLGRALDLPWLDMDPELETRTGRSIARWIREDEPGFRAAERALFGELLHEGRARVIASGGGLVAQPGFFGEYGTRAYFVALDGEPELLAARVTAGAPRPLLAAAPPGGLATLLERRRPLYRQAHVTLALRAGEPPLATLDRLLEILEPALLESAC